MRPYLAAGRDNLSSAHVSVTASDCAIAPGSVPTGPTKKRLSKRFSIPRAIARPRVRVLHLFLFSKPHKEVGTVGTTAKNTGCPYLVPTLSLPQGGDNFRPRAQVTASNDNGRLVGHDHALESTLESTLEGETRPATRFARVHVETEAQAWADDGPRQGGPNRHRCRRNERQAGVQLLGSRGENDPAVSTNGRRRSRSGESLRGKEENSLSCARRGLEVDSASIPPEGRREARAARRCGGQQADPGGRWSHQDRRGPAQREHGTGCAR